MKIEIELLSEDAPKRYPTLGDWTVSPDALQVKAYADDEDEAFLIALHELVEAWLCRKHGVSQEVVDDFDRAFQGGEDDEPGDDPHAPYRAEHRQAMLIEHLMANFLDLDSYGTIK